MVFCCCAIYSQNQDVPICSLLCNFSNSSEALNRRIMVYELNDDGNSLINAVVAQQNVYQYDVLYVNSVCTDTQYIQVSTN
jgi:hypothetical protein